MAFGSKKRDYVIGDRAIAVNIFWHKTKMEQLIKEGMNKDDASKKAYDECVKLNQSQKKTMLKKWEVIKENNWILK